MTPTEANIGVTYQSTHGRFLGDIGYSETSKFFVSEPVKHRLSSSMPDLQAIIRLVESKRKFNFPWKRQEPYEQPYFLYNDSTKSWQPGRPSPTHSSSQVSAFEILSWNIDFMLPFPNQRMQVALDHLQTLISSSPHPSIIFLNECLVSDLQLIQSQPWIQQSYHITDLNDEYWESGHYGTTTLIPKSLPISKVFRVHYEATKMERDVLCVDLSISNKIVRVCNSHLESLIADPPLRPRQAETASTFMHASEVHGSVIGGDFNAIQPFDCTLHSDNDLLDAYLETEAKRTMTRVYLGSDGASQTEGDVRVFEDG